MKRIFLTLIIILWVSNLLYSSDSPKNFYKFQKYKNIFKKSECECDLCASIIGLDPNYNKNSIGLRYSYFEYLFESETTNENLNRNNPHYHQVEHSDHSEGSSKETYSNIEIFGKYLLTPKVRLSFNLPYALNVIDGKRIYGMGDLTILSQYQIYQTKAFKESNFKQRIFIGTGIKFPTGEFNNSIVYGVIEPHFQPGSGSFDFLLNGSYIAKFKDIGFTTDILYTFNTSNGNDYLFANRLNITSYLFSQISVSNISLIPNIGMYYEQAGLDQNNGIEETNSGGKILFTSFGLNISLEQFSFNSNYQLPVTEYLNGIQPENKRRFAFDLSYSF